MSEQIYRSNKECLSGTSYSEVRKAADGFYKSYTSRTKRQPYIRSAYFSKNKVFLAYFWQHLYQKNWHDRARRLKFFAASLDLIKNSKLVPKTTQNPNKKNELLHRFEGRTKDGQMFTVQIKEDKKNDKKFFMSVFPKK